MSTNVQLDDPIVMIMLYVITRWDTTSADAKHHSEATEKFAYTI
jgi:hypothetical protein